MTSGYLRGSNNLLAGASAQGGYTIEESLRFNASQSSYLSWTPASAGNRKTWTWSGWVKRGQLGTTQQLFYAKDGTNYVLIGFTTNNQLQIQLGTPRRRTVRVFRDPSAWYHIVGICDTTDATGDDRLQLWVNGVRETGFDEDTDPTLNANYTVNNTVQHNIGRGDATHYSDGYITEVNFIDGDTPAYTTRIVNGVTQTVLTELGEFDATTGVWKPKQYTGTYGTNGFYLPMKLDNTTEGFNTVTYLGTGSKQQIGGVGFNPDLVWIKGRTTANSHLLADSVRGDNKVLISNSTGAEITDATYTAFLSDGFSVSGSYPEINQSGASYVAWCWDAGSSTVTNTDGSITSSVRANPTYGFSVVTFTGTGANATVGHGLGATPSMVIVKNRDFTANWNVWFTGYGANDYLLLNTTGAKATFSGNWGVGTFDSSLFSVGANNGTNGSTDSMVAYCFSEVSGYSKFGSYTGNGSTSGPTVTLGWKPAFVMIKGSSLVSQWNIVDATRDAVNPADKRLFANLSNAETTGINVCTFTDTGFTINNSDAGFNQSGSTYIYMAFKDTREYAFWLDDSGNNNDWQPNGGITTESTVTDTPTPYLGGGNYAVMNPLDKYLSDGSITNGNLTLNGTSNWNACRGSLGMSSGKWYWETVHSVYNQSICGIADKDWPPSTYYPGYSTTGYSAAYGNSGARYVDGSSSAYGSAFIIGDVIGYALDMDAGTLTCYKNGVSQGEMVSGLTAYGTIFPAIAAANGAVINANFGQRPFAYTPPTGFKALHTGNLPDSSIVDGSKYFDALTYSGNGTTQSITGLEFQPDFVWVKGRNNVGNHTQTDAVRGAQLALFSNLTNAETSDPTGLTSFDADGFSVGSATRFNGSGNTYVAWNWKANGTGVSNTDGSITSTVSANPTAGFSIVSYTGTGTSTGDSFGHGLGVQPKMVVIKNRTTAGTGWGVLFPEFMTASQYMALNLTNGITNSANSGWGGSLPDSTKVYVGGSSWTNTNGNNYVAYCFAEVEGYSKFGSFLGNSSTDGPFVYTGFRPAYVLVKRTNTTGNWRLQDTARNEYNTDPHVLFPNLSDAEGTGSTNDIDILSNGFKARNNSTDYNASGSTYIYIAFAENPFKNSLAR